MNLEAIRKVVRVQWMKLPGLRIATATLDYSREIHVPDNLRFEPAFSDSDIEERLVEDFMRELYADRRMEIWGAVKAVQSADPYSSDQIKAINRLFDLMRKMQPE